MSRTREISVWVDKTNIEENGKEICIWHKVSTIQEKFLLKATLKIELPERKVTISESDLRNCFDSFARLENDHDRVLVYSFYEFSKELLFKDAE